MGVVNHKRKLLLVCSKAMLAQKVVARAADEWNNIAVDLPEFDLTDQTQVGVAFNLEELLFRPRQNLLGQPGRIANTALKYIQIPGTSVNHNDMERFNR